MGKIVLDKVLGKNLQDFADNIDKNFNRIESNGIWRGEKGESYVEKTIDLWREDTDGNIVIINEDILRVLFTEADGSASAWPLVKSWAENNKDQFISLQIPKTWSLYPGFPLYYTQPAECFKMFKSDTDDTGTDWSGMVAAVGSDEGSYVYKRYDILPRLYLDVVSGNYCWMINGVKTGVTASINPDQETRNIRLYLIRTAADGSIQYMVDKESGTGWYKNPDIYPRVGDFAWRLETKNITSGGETRDAQVLEVCMYDGNTWIAAAADDDNENFLLTYDDMVMQYIWKSIYGGLGDEYDGDMRAVDTKSFQLPAHDDNGNATTDSHKITSKSYSNGKRSDIFIENPYKGQNPEVKSNIVLSGYDNIYLNPPTIQSDGSVKYNDEWVIKKSELDEVNAAMDKRVSDLESHVIKTITIEELWNLTINDVNDGDIYKIDRCYWKDKTVGSSHYNYNAIYVQRYVGTQGDTGTPEYEYEIHPYVRYVYIRACIDDNNLTWYDTGIGIVNIVWRDDAGISHRKSYPVEVRLQFCKYSGDTSWKSGYDPSYTQTTSMFIGMLGDDGISSGDFQTTYITNESVLQLDEVELGDNIDIDKFGIITWMKDPMYKNECDWDFVMYDTFRVKYTYIISSIPILRKAIYYLPYFSTFYVNGISDINGCGCSQWFYKNKLTARINNAGIGIPNMTVSDIGYIYRMIEINMSSIDSSHPICHDNAFELCNEINISIISNNTDRKGYSESVHNNYAYNSIVSCTTSTFCDNIIRNSTLYIGYNNYTSNMQSCNIIDSTINYGIGINGGFNMNDSNKLLNIKSPEFFNVLFQYCDFNHIRNLESIFIICPTDYLFGGNDNGYGYITLNTFNGHMTPIPSRYRVVCLNDDGSFLFNAYFIGIDTSALGIADSNNDTINISDIVYSYGYYDPTKMSNGYHHDKRITLLSPDVAEKYSYINIGNAGLYPILGVGYTKSLENILKN